MREMDDWELVALAQGGDMEAFSALVQRYQNPVIQFCRRMIGSAQDAEEVAQDSFVRLHRHLRRLEPKAKFSTLLFGIARNLALNHLRNSGRRGRSQGQPLDGRHHAAAAQQPDRQARLRELEQGLEQGIAELSHEHREVLLLREFQGMDYDLIAQTLHCRKGTVKSRLARAREQLRLRMLALGDDWT